MLVELLLQLGFGELLEIRPQLGLDNVPLISNGISASVPALGALAVSGALSIVAWI